MIMAASFRMAAQTWTGATSSDWFTPANWTPATVPGSTSFVTIPGALSTYPVLTGNVTIGRLTMNAGSALNLAGNTLTDNGNIAMNTAVISGSGTFNVLGSASVSILASSIAATTNITGYTSACNFLNNTITGNTTIADDPTQNSSANNISGNTINGNFVLTHASAQIMYEGYAGNAANHITGNATYNLTGSGTFYSAYSYPLQVDGNFTVNRTAAGSTALFYSGSTVNAVGGNFTYNSVGGDTYLNDNNAAVVQIGGTININATDANAFHLVRMKNGIAGGSILANGSTNLSLRGDTLKANVALTQYQGSCAIYDNSITGNTTLSNVSTQNSSANYIDGSLFTGDLSISHASLQPMYEGYGSALSLGNHVTGNLSCTLSGAGAFYSSYANKLTVDGNFTINRTVDGLTELYRSNGTPATVGGDFTLNSSGGSTMINAGNVAGVFVAGTVNIAMPAATNVQIVRLRNGVAGGSVSLQGAGYVSILTDTLLATVSIQGYTGTFQCHDNSFTGNVTIASAVSQNSNANYLDGSRFIGNLSITHAAATDLLEGYGGSSGLGNYITGNATINVTGTGSFTSSYSHTIKVDGNFTVTRTTAGTTELFRSNPTGSNIGGNFSLTSVGGSNVINPAGANTVMIGGTVNLSLSASGPFVLKRVKNTTSGGQVNIGSASTCSFNGDTLLADVAITGYTSSMNFLDNSISGNTVIADDVSQNSGLNYIDGNLIGGNFTLVHSAPGAILYEGYGSTSGLGNVVRGRDSIVNVPGAAQLNLSYTNIHRADSTFILNAASGVVLDRLSFGGSGNGRLRQAGAQGFVLNMLDINKTGNAALTLDTTLTITGTANFVGGYINASPAHRFIFANNAAWTGAGNASHITGPVVKAGNQAFTFPLGNGAFYSPASITAPANATDTFLAQYIKSSPHLAGYDSNLRDASINHISRAEYWLINRAAGTTSTPKVTLGYNRPNSGEVNNMAQLTVAHWYGAPAYWHDEGNSVTTGNNSFGTIQSSNSISTFSPFTLASTTIANPLPVKLMAFDARKVNDEAVLNWKTAEETNLTGFEVFRSADARNFERIGTVTPNNRHAGSAYEWTDKHPKPGANYYRLAVVGASGDVVTSAVKTLTFGDGAARYAIYPNPAHEVLNISGFKDWNSTSVRIYNAAGQVVTTGLQTGLAGQLLLSNVPAGIYVVEISEGANREHFRLTRR